ncbi:uncharacterized protein B0I36DRAFT_388081 [Microdochium trichocladiopsis]|uniref:Nephrocystin 3-like N-terminal domain-containing protein n=1 Tax=Microdochium trichocladiopsis TaxID=1682393 RepID=A0A9P8XWT2_9PEZI|nr:uncharacterized protein B0I36DRAFT_388081 [Microdochium trichocladiopsis]KAH7021351.1 hypothetical protein B0I36DRAFT_388081 [Microdochium trichocladiopsis]
MDPLSLSVNIITLIDTGQKIITFLQELKDAPAARQDFLLDGQSSYLVLWRLKDQLGRLQDAASENDLVWLTNFSCAVQSDSVLGQLKACLEEIQAKLSPRDQGKHFQKLQQAAKWKFTKADLESSFQRLGRITGMIELCISSESLAWTTSLGKAVQDIKLDTKTIIKRQLTEHEKQERKNILDWVEKRANHYEVVQAGYYSRAPGTWKWFIESDSFQQWVAGETPLLYCPGIPGAGKTIMASMVINFLQSRLPQPEGYLAVAYFNYKLITSHEKHEGLDRNVDAILDLLSGTIQDSGVVFIALDALDEVSNKDEPNGRKSLLNSVWKLQQAGNENQVRILATARPNTELPATFVTEIYSAEHGPGIYLKTRVADLDCLPEVGDEVEVSEIFQQKIIKRMIDAADGMFLLAAFHAE